MEIFFTMSRSTIKTLNEKLSHLREETRVHLNKDKCVLMPDEMVCLAHCLNYDGVQPTAAKVESINSPMNIVELGSNLATSCSLSFDNIIAGASKKLVYLTRPLCVYSPTNID